MAAPTPLFSGLYTRSANATSRSLTLPTEAVAGTLLLITAGYRSQTPYDVWSPSLSLTTVEEYINTDGGSRRLRHHSWTYVVQSGDTAITWTGDTESGIIILHVFEEGCTVNASDSDFISGSSSSVALTTTEPSWVLFSATRSGSFSNPYWTGGIEVNNTDSGGAGNASTRYADGIVSQTVAGTTTATRATNSSVSWQAVAIESPAAPTSGTLTPSPATGNATALSPTLTATGSATLSPVAASGNAIALSPTLSGVAIATIKAASLFSPSLVSSLFSPSKTASTHTP